MAVVFMRSGVEHLITDERGKKLIDFMLDQDHLPAPRRRKNINLNGSGHMISLSSISEVMMNTDYDTYVHKKNNDRQCDAGHWFNPKSQDRCGACEAEFSKTSFIHQPPQSPTSPQTKERTELWKEAIRRSMVMLKTTGKYGRLTPEDILREREETDDQTSAGGQGEVRQIIQPDHSLSGAV